MMTIKKFYENEKFYDNEDVLMKKATYFHNNNLPIHISKHNGIFHNGTIITIEKDFILLNEDVEGEIPIFFIEIKRIEKRTLDK